MADPNESVPPPSVRPSVRSAVPKPIPFMAARGEERRKQGRRVRPSVESRDAFFNWRRCRRRLSICLALHRKHHALDRRKEGRREGGEEVGGVERRRARDANVILLKIGFMYCKWSNLNAPGSVSFASGLTVDCFLFLDTLCQPRPLSSLYAWRKREMLHVVWVYNKVEILCAKMGYMGGKWSNLNASGSSTPWSLSPLGSTMGCPFSCTQEKENAACSLLKQRKFIFQK